MRSDNSGMIIFDLGEPSVLAITRGNASPGDVFDLLGNVSPT